MSKIAPVLVLALLITACGQASEESPGDTTLPTSTDTTQEQDEMSTTSPTEGAPVEAATSDLAGRLKVGREEITVVRADPVTWPDGSLGCPEPGTSYTQALVDGYQIVLRHGDTFFDYHAGSDAEPFLCPSDEPGGGYEFVPKPGPDK